jgi:hypothetical protein
VISIGDRVFVFRASRLFVSADLRRYEKRDAKIVCGDGRGY